MKKLPLVVIVAALAAGSPVFAGADEDRRAVAALDVQYQQAVKANDAETMAKILHDDFVLVTGQGDVFTKQQLVDYARRRVLVYQRQDEEPGSQTVRVFGDTAIVTAELWIQRTGDGKSVDKKLWFSDTYVRTPSGWRYFFGQASLALPAES
jgi:uncharacterized protein (TIGR02246 family)